MVEKLQGGKRPKGCKRVFTEWSCLARCPGTVQVYSNSLAWCNFLTRSFILMVCSSPGTCLWWSHPLQSQEPFPQGSWKPVERQSYQLCFQRPCAHAYLYTGVSTTPRHIVHFCILYGFFFLSLFIFFSFPWDLKLRHRADGKHLPVLCAWKT